MIDRQLIADGTEVLTQQPVIVERTDQVLHDIPLALSQFCFAHLFLQLVIE